MSRAMSVPVTSVPVTSVAIIGLGSRGLSVLERIITLARNAGPAAGHLRVEIIDPTCSGAGVHDPAQPGYLLLNTTCSQVSMFGDHRSVGAATGEPGPSLHGWVTGRGLRLAADGFTVGPQGRPIRPTDFLPRRVLGEYLGWFFTRLREQVPAHVQLTCHRAEAVDMWSGPGETLAVALSDGHAVSVEYVFLTTGYTPNEQATEQAAGGERIIAEPYPLPERLAQVEPGQTVALAGFGLSAMDVMSSLTVGRGGRFVTGSAGLEYLPGGREPRLLMYSRSGVPHRARPLVTRFGFPYEPLVFTRAGIDALRASRGGPLDFEADVMPLILTEMRIAYRRCQARCAGPKALAALAGDLARAVDAPGIAAVLDRLDERLGGFDPRAAFEGSAGMRLAGRASYQQWLAGVVRADLDQGVLGFARSPVKAGLDILRELRDTIRYTVDFGGLTAQSLEDFHRRVVPMINRAVVGPQFERYTELLALMSAGIIQVPFGPAPAVTWNAGRGTWVITSTSLGQACSAEADWLAAASVPLPAADFSASPLLRALHRRGWIRRHRPGSRSIPGIDVDRGQHPVGTQGQPLRRVWALGPLCEGATYYTNLVPSPEVYSRPLADAHRCVAAMFAARRALPEPAGLAESA